VGQIESVQLCLLNGLLQLCILKLRHLATLRAYLMMMRIAVITFFVLGRDAELMLDDQMSIYQKNDGIVEGSPADTKLFLLYHQRIQGIYIKMTVYGINRIKYGEAFGSLPMPVRVEIFGEYLPYRIFHILTFHIGVQLFTAYKVKPFLLKASDNRDFFFKSYREREKRGIPK
jgi:hypothetical protein